MKKNKGINLVELLIALCVGSLLLSLAAPPLSDLTKRMAVRSSSQQLITVIAMTRQLAIQKRQAIILANRQGAWHNGWHIFVDVNGNGLQDDQEPSLRTQDALTKGIEAYANAPISQYIRYLPDGRAHLLNGGFQAGTLWICHQQKQISAIQLIINAGGRLRQSSGHCPY